MSTEKKYQILNLNDFDAINKFLDALSSEGDIVAFDIETNSENEHKARVIGIGVTWYIGEGYYIPFAKFDKEKNTLVDLISQEIEKEFVTELCNILLGKKIIGHNLVYDFVTMYNAYGIDLTSAMYADTILMKHTIDEERPFGLKEVAEKFKEEIGFSAEDAANQEQLDLKQSVIDNGGKWTKFDKEIYKGDMSLIGTYCCADVDLTLRLFEYFEYRMEKEGLQNFYYNQEVMPLYRHATIPMKMSGVYVDVEYFKKLEAELESDIMSLTDAVFDQIKDDIEPLVRKILDDKIKESRIGRFAEGVLRYYELPVPLNKKTGKPTLANSALQSLKAAYPNHIALEWLTWDPPMVEMEVTEEIEEPILEEREVLEEIQVGDETFYEKTQKLVEVGTKKVVQKVKKLVEDPSIKGPSLPAKVVFEIKKRIFVEDKPDLPYVFNLSSNAHLAWLLFTRHGQEPVSHSKKTGAPQVNKDSLEHYVHLDFMKSLLRLKKEEKLLSTYVKPILESNIGGWIYPSMLQFGTTSGRYSCAGGLNLQTLPRFEKPKRCKCNGKLKVTEPNLMHMHLKCESCDYQETILNGFMIKRGFIAPPGYKVVNADFSSLEPRIFSWVSGDFRLKGVWQNNLDLYSQIAIDVFGLEGVSAREADDNFLKKIMPDERQKSKVFTLAVPYGANEYRIAGLMKIEPMQAKEIIDNYLGSYPGLKDFMRKQETDAKTQGFVKTKFGRIRHLTEAQEMYRKFGPKIYNKHEMKKYYKDWGTEQYYKFRNLLNNAKNFPIQATAAHVANAALIKLALAFKKHKIEGWIALQIHDEITCIVKDHHAELAAKLLKDAMENNEITRQIDIPILAEPIIATNFAEAK